MSQAPARPRANPRASENGEGCEGVRARSVGEDSPGEERASVALHHGSQAEPEDGDEDHAQDPAPPFAPTKGGVAKELIDGTSRLPDRGTESSGGC